MVKVPLKLTAQQMKSKKMKWLFTSLVIISALCAYLLSPTSQSLSTEIVDLTDKQNSSKLEDIDFIASNDKKNEKSITNQPDSKTQIQNQQSNISKTDYNETEYIDEAVAPLAKIEPSNNKNNISDEDYGYATPLLDTEPYIEKLPGEDINFQLKIHASTHHLIEGRANSDIGKILFKSSLMPSNEIKLSIKLKQNELDDIQLLAYIDLANFTMDLDGGNSVLNKKHKELMVLTLTHLRSKLERQYEGYDVPEHALMLTQMLGYWSISPEGYVHEKRSIVSE
jgi:hypothetical protein